MFPWHNIDTVLLDMDGTLLDLHFDNFFWMHHRPKVYAETHQLGDAESTKRLHAAFSIDQGTLDWYSLDFWSDRLKLDIPAI